MEKEFDIHKLNIQPQAGVIGVFSRLNYKPWYAIAEFVDNSTQSFYNNEKILKEAGVLNITVKQGDKSSILISGEEKAFPFIPERGKEYNVQITLTNNEDKIGGNLDDRCS